MFSLRIVQVSYLQNGLSRRHSKMLEVQLKRNKDVTNSNLEALGLVAAFLFVATNIDVKNKTIETFCDNNSTVG